MAKKDYARSIPWPVLENFLLKRRETYLLKSMTAPLEDIKRLQGFALAYNELLNLPELLELREAEVAELES